MNLLINDFQIGTTQSNFIYFDDSKKVLIFSSDGDDKISLEQSSNSLFRMLDKNQKKGYVIKLQFGRISYTISDVVNVINEHGIEVALKADVLAVERY